MRTTTIAAAIALAASAAGAQQVSERAIAECQNSDFREIADCLPLTQLAFDMLGAIQHPDLFGTDGAALVLRCKKEEQRVAAQWMCVSYALDDAAKLLALVGDVAKIEDPLMEGLADPAKLEEVKEIEREFAARIYGAGQ